MQRKRKISTKIKLLLLTLMFLIPINAFFFANNKNSDIISQKPIKDDKTEDVKTPLSSAYYDQAHAFKINGTKLYENGTFYLFQTDNLYFSFENKTGTTNVAIVISALSMSFNLVYKGNSLYDSIQVFNTLGRYRGVLSYYNFSNPAQRWFFDFYLDIGNPSPRIIKAWGRDTEYNPTYKEIVEGGVYATLRKTSFELLVETLNKGSVASDVDLNYTDGIAYTQKALTISATSGYFRNFTLTGGNAISINIDTTSGYENRWKPTDTLYKFVLNASDSTDFYLFEFSIEIKNDPPLITRFNLSPSYVQTPTSPVSVVISVNASDMEDDTLYYRGSQDNAKYTDPVGNVSVKTGCTVTSPLTQNLDYLKTDDSDYYSLTYGIGANGEFWVWLDINDEINLDKISSFETKFIIRNNAYPKAEVHIYDFTVKTWRLLANLTNKVTSYTTITNQSSQLAVTTAKNYYSPTNKSMLLRFCFNDPVQAASVDLDYVAVTTTVTRRESFSRVVLLVHKPEGAIDIVNLKGEEEIEIINYWDNALKYWSYTYIIENDTHNYGSWTFQILFADHGKSDYFNLIWGNYTNALSSSSKDQGLYEFDYQQKHFGEAIASKVFCLGIPQSQALNISAIPFTNSTRGMAPLYDESFNVTLNVNGVDTSNLYYKDFQTRTLISEIQIQKNTSYAEITKITCNADVSGSLNGTYFFINTPIEHFYVFIYMTNALDPKFTDKTLINITTIGVGTSANLVAARLATAIQNIGGSGANFTATSNANVLTITNSQDGAAADASDGLIKTNFAFSTYEQGKNYLYGYSISPLYNITGNFNDMNVDNEGKSYSFKLAKNMTGHYAFYSAVWKLRLVSKWWLSPANISELAFTIDNWFNSTNDINNVYIEFWNYSSETWIQFAGWANGALKKYTNNNTQFSKVITDKTQLNWIIDNQGFLSMRLKIETNTPSLKRDYNLSIDFINATIKYRNYYYAKLQLRSANNPDTPINLVPYKKGSYTMQYSAIINIKNLGLKADNFTMMFLFQNGNSSLFYLAYRISPRVLSGQFQNNYYYNPSKQTNLLDKNYTLNIAHIPIAFTKALTVNKMLYFLDVDTLIMNATADLKTLASGDLDVLSVDIRIGTNVESRYWLSSERSGLTIIYEPGTDSLSLSDAVNYDAHQYTFGVYFVRFYLRTMTGLDYATEWKEIRVLNSAPVDFDFTFCSVNPNPMNRLDTYSFDFWFTDYEMTKEQAFTSVQIRFEINNKSNSNKPEWIYASLGSINDVSESQNKIHFSAVSILIPRTTRTGAYNWSYYKWEFLVNDSNYGIQSEFSYLSFNRTIFVIRNAAPSIAMDATASQVYRNNSVKISFNILDPDDLNPNALTVTYFNISAVDPTPDVSVSNNSVPFVSGKREYIYFVARSAELGKYNVSLRIIDNDTREAFASASFNVINNLPTVVSSIYSQNNILRDVSGRVFIFVNVSDVEDSWLGDNATDDVYVELFHKSPYSARIQQISPSIEPIRINMTLIYAANFTNGNRELWMGNVTFNDTMDSQKFYAGALTVIVHTEDSDGATPTSQCSDLIVLNNAPTLWWYEFESEEVDSGDDITFYVYATDVEGISFIKIWYFPIVGSNERKEKVESREYYAADWEIVLLAGVNVYKCSFSTDSLPDETVKVEIDKITVYDTDYEYKNDELYGATFDVEDKIELTIEIKGVTVTTGQPIIVLAFIIVGAIAVVALIAVGIVIYKKKSGWRRFMD